ncbi:MAG TPA: 2'-5' RNA ligase family protein, partial [Bacillota bacterium]|nr:2'-5' RNA ligase family protein [Bacillota bacterium]
MFNRCILIFPQFENESVIREIRDKYDPLAKHVEPHITLIFPFESDLKTEELKGHLITVLKDIKPFEIQLKGINPVNNYLFLEVEKGKEKIIELHK